MPRFKQEVLEFLSTHTTCRLATATPEGIPHIAAVSYVNDDSRVFICTAKKSKKARNMLRNPRIALIVDDDLGPSGWRYVVVKGTAESVTDVHEYGTIRGKLYQKYASWEAAFPITEGRDLILVINPWKILTANL
jgi:PPOX class probable F420-dependent enzyme